MTDAVLAAASVRSPGIRCPPPRRICGPTSSRQRPLKQLGRGAPYLLDALRMAINPYPLDNIPKVIWATTSTCR